MVKYCTVHFYYIDTLDHDGVNTVETIKLFASDKSLKSAENDQ